MHAAIRAEQGLPAGISRLREVSRSEGFRFVDRLVLEWSRGDNRFCDLGELFLCCYRDGALVGFGGLNRDPYSPDRGWGRIRHVYFEPAARGLGLGGLLVRDLIRRANPPFQRLRLSTQQAAPFYEHLGFLPVSEYKATHALQLDRAAERGAPTTRAR